MKKIRIRNRLLLFVLVLALFVPSANVCALTQKQKAFNAYKSMLSKSKVSIVSSGSPTPSSKVQFAIAYIDNNDVPELIVKRSDGLFAVFTYKNNKIYRVKKGNGYDKFVGYYKKTGGYKLFDSTGKEGSYYIYYNENYYLLTNSGTTQKISKYVYLGPTDRNPRTPMYMDYTSYNKGHGVAINHSTFKSKFVSLTKGKSLTKVKYYSNTAANRKKYLK